MVEALYIAAVQDKQMAVAAYMEAQGWNSHLTSITATLPSVRAATLPHFALSNTPYLLRSTFALCQFRQSQSIPTLTFAAQILKLSHIHRQWQSLRKSHC